MLSYVSYYAEYATAQDIQRKQTTVQTAERERASASFSALPNHTRIIGVPGIINRENSTKSYQHEAAMPHSRPSTYDSFISKTYKRHSKHTKKHRIRIL